MESERKLRMESIEDHIETLVSLGIVKKPTEFLQYLYDNNLIVGKEEEEFEESNYNNTALLDYTIQFSRGHRDWRPFFDQEIKISIPDISKFLVEEAKSNTIYPPLPLVYNVFSIVKPQDIRVLIIGQDPYINEGEAMGIAFSVTDGLDITPTFKNIKKELVSCGFKTRAGISDLTRWCEQGIFLVNTALTVRAGKSKSHFVPWAKKFTQNLMKWLNKNCKPMVILTWGGPARSYTRFFDLDKHCHITASHPSPLGANASSQGVPAFLGSKCFLKVNDALEEMGYDRIDWNLI